MEDPVMQIELALNFVNTLLAKAVFFKDTQVISDLHAIRHAIYYESEFDYDTCMQKLQKIDTELKRYTTEQENELIQKIKNEKVENKEQVPPNEGGFKVK